MKAKYLLMLLFSASAWCETTLSNQPLPPAVEPKLAPSITDFNYECVASTGKEQKALVITVYRQLSQREPPLRMKVVGTWMNFQAFEMFGKDNVKMLNLFIQATDKKGRSIAAQRSEFYGQPPTKGFYTRLGFGKAAITCELKTDKGLVPSGDPSAAPQDD